MEQSLMIWVLGAVFSVAWGLTFYMLKKNSDKSDKNENEIIMLKERQISEEKLTVIIEKAVRTAFLEYENKLLKQQKEGK